MSRRYNKLIFFDLDGTLIEGFEYIWQHLWSYFELEELASEETKRYFAKTISYDQWFDNDLGLLRGLEVTKADLITAIGSLKVVPGVRDTLLELKSRGYGIFVVSGGLDFVLHHIVPDWEKLIDEVFINRIEFDGSGRVSGGWPTTYDFEHKATCIADIAKRYRVPLEKTVFVGDNDNDASAAIKAGVSIAFNSRSKRLSEVVSYKAVSNDLRSILGWL